MGVYTEYLDRDMDFQELSAERKAQLKRISELRNGRAVLVFAADLNATRVPTSIYYGDVLPFSDQLDNVSGNRLDLILETPGGSGEVAEELVRLLRGRFDEVNVIVPGWAKSAGTIITMAADEILMGPASALGPIDAQIQWQGKVFSADALLKGLDKIKAGVEGSGKLNQAYIPILQGLSPGELEHAENALEFAKVLVRNWLCEYKFKDWTTHSSTGRDVTPDERRERASEVAAKLADHTHWRTHGRSIKIDDLTSMRLRITDFSENAPLADAIHRYQALLQMTFGTNIFKVFETPNSQIYRFSPNPGNVTPSPKDAKTADLDVDCPKCQEKLKVQANLEEGQPLKEGSIAFPEGDDLKCPSCGHTMNLADARRQIEAVTKKKVLT